MKISEVNESELGETKMSKLTWSKWQWDVHSREWDIHPAWMEGAWMRVLRRLHFSENTGTLTMDIESWARATGCSQEETKTFITHLDENGIADIRLAEKITITCRRMKKQVKKTEGNRARQAKYRKSDTKQANTRRDELLGLLRESYHPNKAFLQPSWQVTELKSILADATSKEETPEAVIAAEDAVIKKITSYMDTLRETKTWKEEGTYLMGLGNFLKARAWNSKVKVVELRSNWEGVDPKFAAMWGSKK